MNGVLYPMEERIDVVLVDIVTHGADVAACVKIAAGIGTRRPAPRNRSACIIFSKHEKAHSQSGLHSVS